MTSLSSTFIAGTQHSPVSIQFADRDILMRNTNARTGGALGYGAELQVVDGGEVVGYITPYSDDEYGSIKASMFGQILPRLCRSVDEALHEILG